MTQAFLYKWTELSTGKWYIGSRTAKNCNINDGYICSSKIVKPLIKSNPNDWERKILCIGYSDYILNLEISYLTLLDAKNDPMSYNMYNGDYKFIRLKTHSLESRKKMSEIQKGKKLSDEHRKKLSEAKQNITEEYRQKLSNAKIGTKHSEETRKKMSKSKQGYICLESTRQKISQSNKGKPNINKGKPRSEEIRKKISETLLRKNGNQKC